MNQQDIDALVSGNYDDIHAVLGLQAEKGKLLVRCFLPGALSVEVIDSKTGKSVASLDSLHDDGLFAGPVGSRKKPFDYRLRVKYPDITVDLNDPYGFASQLSDDDIYLFGEGTQERLYHWMGAHPRDINGVSGTQFVVWAPNAKRVSVVGDFNQWDGRRHVLRKHPASGIWDIFIPDLGEGALYKYEIRAANGDLLPLKADPYGFATGHPSETASKVVSLGGFEWSDADWMAARAQNNVYQQPMSVYEVHAGSWQRVPEEGNRFQTYREMANALIPYVKELGFTHIQFMPLSEFPFDGSWGYQPIGLFAPTSRFGTPDDFRYFVDCCHAEGIGVILDWVPGHFPTDEHGLGRFDGSALYEHEDKRQGFHPDWNTLIYNYGRREVISYLLSNAMYWLDQFHIDGLRVDAVASMLYLDYSREEGQWIPNEHGGRENLAAIELLRQVNSRVYFNYPGVLMIAEESTAFGGVSRPVSEGGLGFGFKWNMGWMNDTLAYMERDPVHRKYHHDDMTFSLVYAFSENFVLPLSHDEVVHGKGSLINKMPGDDWQRFANLRALLAFQWTHPGKKLLFMGGEFAQFDEWNHNQSLDWHLLQYDRHQGIKNLVRDLNLVYTSLPALHQKDSSGEGFEWVDVDNRDHSLFAFARYGDENSAAVVVVLNLTPTPLENYPLGVPRAGRYVERLNTDAAVYGGSNLGNGGSIDTTNQSAGRFSSSLTLTIPPLAGLVLEHVG